MTTLFELINNERSDKNTVHSYLDVYQPLFEGKKDSAKNVLEIGISEGGSIKLWYDYFSNANIYGLDIRKIKDVWPELRNNKRIFLGCFDAYESSFFENHLLNKNLKFDILIDDGPHTLESMIFFIKNYSKLLELNGILVVEDVASIDWIEPLTNAVPDELKQYIEVYDLRDKKNRYDDILFVINLDTKY